MADKWRHEGYKNPYDTLKVRPESDPQGIAWSAFEAGYDYASEALRKGDGFHEEIIGYGGKWGFIPDDPEKRK